MRGFEPHMHIKGRKAGTGGKMANFMVAIAYGKGVVLCKQYEEILREISLPTSSVSTFPVPLLTVPTQTVNVSSRMAIQGKTLLL